MMSLSGSSSLECPLCFQPFPASVLQTHASGCTGKETPHRAKREREQDAGGQGDDGTNNKRTKRESTTPNGKADPPPSTASPSSSPEFDPSLQVPLAEQMRPRALGDLRGQDQVTGHRSALRSMLATGDIPSLVLWGPPGCGKTSLANVVAQACKEDRKFRFVKMSACTAGVADVKEVVKASKNEQRLTRRRTVLFVDEVHRFNKLQQDAFLPHVEDGTITLLGATTENPSFSLNSALLSRCRVVTLSKLTPEAVYDILSSAAQKLGLEVQLAGASENGEGESGLSVTKEALEYLSNVADGDARTALNCLQLAFKACRASDSRIDLSVMKENLKRAHVLYDRKGDEHYHCASALQKSIRGSNDSAALYWCMRMLQGGEDPLFIARRLVRIAGEDVGLADPQALPMAVAAMQGCQLIGRPECNVLLAEAAVYLARAKKSHEVYHAMTKVLETFKEGNLPGVPIHLRNATTKLAKDLNYGKGYSYNLSEVGDIEYMPEGMEDVTFF